MGSSVRMKAYRMFGFGIFAIIAALVLRLSTVYITGGSYSGSYIIRTALPTLAMAFTALAIKKKGSSCRLFVIPLAINILSSWQYIGTYDIWSLISFAFIVLLIVALFVRIPSGVLIIGGIAYVIPTVIYVFNVLDYLSRGIPMYNIIWIAESILDTLGFIIIVINVYSRAGRRMYKSPSPKVKDKVKVTEPAFTDEPEQIPESIEDELRALKKQYDDGLINAVDYRVKRQDILSKL